MIKKLDTNKSRIKRHRRVRKKVSGTPERPRLNVFRSNKHIYAQIIDDVNMTTLVSACSLEKGFSDSGSNKSGARIVGSMIAKKALKKNIKNVVFDRGGFIYHGRVQELAEGAREGGLEF